MMKKKSLPIKYFGAILTRNVKMLNVNVKTSHYNSVIVNIVNFIENKSSHYYNKENVFCGTS